MNTHETVREMTQGQLKDITATMIGAIPDLTFDQAQSLIGDKGIFVLEIQEAFKRYLGNKGLIKSEPAFTYNKRKDGWEIVQDVGFKPSITIANLELVSFLNKGEDHIDGEELVRRARTKLANLGQKHAEYLLQHQGEIPKEFRDYYLVFPGTIWRNRAGIRRVSDLHWHGERWYLSFNWLGYVWRGNDRLLRPRE